MGPIHRWLTGFLVFVCFDTLSAQGQPAPRPQTGPPAELERIAGIVGEWDMQFETPAKAGQPAVVLKASSRIERILGGAHFQEWNSVPQPNGKAIRMTALWSYDRYRQVYRMAYLDEHFALFDVNEGNWEGGRLVMTNLRTGTWAPAGGGKKSFSRITIHSLTPDRFILEYDASLDEGKTWVHQVTCTYLRKRPPVDSPNAASP